MVKKKKNLDRTGEADPDKRRWFHSNQNACQGQRQFGWQRLLTARLILFGRVR